MVVYNDDGSEKEVFTYKMVFELKLTDQLLETLIHY